MLLHTVEVRSDITLGVSCNMERNNGEVCDAHVLRSIDLEFWIDDTWLVSRKHRAATNRVYSI